VWKGGKSQSVAMMRVFCCFFYDTTVIENHLTDEVPEGSSRGVGASEVELSAPTANANPKTTVPTVICVHLHSDRYKQTWLQRMRRCVGAQVSHD